MHFGNIVKVHFSLYYKDKMWIEYNPNPVGRKVGDCSVRAIAKALKTDWETAYMMIALNGYNIVCKRNEKNKR